VEGKQTAALVRKGPKLQPIAPTAQFTSHCSVIIPKETDDLEKQFDQSQVKINEMIFQNLSNYFSFVFRYFYMNSKVEKQLNDLIIVYLMLLLV
jgi:hypothetical protein